MYEAFYRGEKPPKTNVLFHLIYVKQTRSRLLIRFIKEKKIRTAALSSN